MVDWDAAGLEFNRRNHPRTRTDWGVCRWSPMWEKLIVRALGEGEESEVNARRICDEINAAEQTLKLGHPPAMVISREVTYGAWENET